MMKYCWAIILLICAVSCSLPGIQKQNLVFTHTNPLQKVRLYVPKGFSSQMVRTDGPVIREIFFLYPDSAVLYCSYQTPWPTWNTPYMSGNAAKDGSSAKGQINHLYWKEMEVEGFRIGYTKVNQLNRELFEQALLSFQLR